MDATLISCPLFFILSSLLSFGWVQHQSNNDPPKSDDRKGHALRVWICGCSLFYKRQLWTSKSACAHSTKSLKISGCKRWCSKDLRVWAPAVPMLTHSLQNKKKWKTGQSCIHKEVNSYKIHTLVNPLFCVWLIFVCFREQITFGYLNNLIFATYLEQLMSY